MSQRKYRDLQKQVPIDLHFMFKIEDRGTGMAREDITMVIGILEL